MTGKFVYTVHAVWLAAGPNGTDQGAIELVELDVDRANGYGKKRSSEPHVKVAVVQRLVIGQFGTRHLVGWWADGVQYGMGDVHMPDAGPAARLPEYLPEHPILSP